jgi:putative CocE/NonD family hydrolase
VIQDCRGTMASEGEFYPYRDEPSDGYDTVEWSASQPWSDGKVGMYGLSYLGATQWASSKERPPHLVAMCPAMIGPSPWDFWFKGGVYQLQAAQLWGLLMSNLMVARKPPPPEEMAPLVQRLVRALDNPLEEAESLPLKEWAVLKETGLADFYFDWLEHPEDDGYWQELQWSSFENSTVPAYVITGWHECLLEGSLACFRGIRERGGSREARDGTKLLVGPWIHETYMLQKAGDIDFGLLSGGAAVDLVGFHLRWFDYWLKGLENGIVGEPPVRIFVMGDNLWRDEQEWPLARTRYTNWYLRSGGRANSLAGDGTLSTQAPGDEAIDTYRYDPEDPVPTRGGRLLTVIRDAGPMDQRQVEERQDVLVYDTAPLEDDLEVTGSITVTLFAASSARDTDFTAKLVDVWPDGTAYNLTDGIVRARYREPQAGPSLIEPGTVYRFTIDVGATSNVFKAGHRIRLEISSSNFPRFDRNLNTGEATLGATRMVPARQTIYHDRAGPSALLLPVVPRGDP